MIWKPPDEGGFFAVPLGEDSGKGPGENLSFIAELKRCANRKTPTSRAKGAREMGHPASKDNVR